MADKQHLFNTVASIFYDGLPVCTGTVVTRNQLLTVAHCIVRVLRERKLFELVNYHAYILHEDKSLRHHQYKFFQVEAHPEYNLRTGKPDKNIALITVIH